MEEIYRIIEEKIKDSGYLGYVNGKEIYDEICDEIEEKENGSYIFMSKKEDDVFFLAFFSINLPIKITVNNIAHVSKYNM